MATAPRQLVEQSTRHAVYLERLKSHDTRLLRELLRDAEDQLLGRLARNDITTWSRARGERQLQAFQAMLSERYGKDILPALNEQIRELAAYEAGFEVRSLENLRVNYQFILPSDAQVMAAVQNNPLSARGPDNGKLLDDFTREWTRNQVSRTTNTIRAGFVQGQTTAQVISALRSEVGPINERGLQALARTALQHAAQQAREATWERNKDIVRRVRIVATLDARTSDICMGMDGRVFPVGEGPRPPFHPNCRTTTTAVLDDRFKVLDEGGTRFARDPETGEAIVGKVPANQTYYSWLKTQPADIQDSMIGPSRGKLLRDGGLSAQRFQELQLGKFHEPLTLDKMRELEPLAFRRAGL